MRYCRNHQTGVTAMETKGKFRIRQTGYEFVLEEDRHGWHIIESLFSWRDVDQALEEYRADGHEIEFHG